MPGLIAALRRAARFAPEPVRARLSSWRYGYSPGLLARRRVPWTCDGDLLHLAFDGVRLTLPRTWEHRLEYGLVRNAASRVEALALVRESRRKPGSVLFDVGAENGLLSILHCAAAGANRAVLFEPVPHFVEEEHAAVALNRMSERAIVRHAAVSDAGGTCGGAIDALGYAQLLPAGQGTFQVPLVRLDEEAARLGLVPDIIKIDVEGHELHVLRGAAGLLRSKPVLFLEVHADLLRRSGQDLAELVALLERAGYRFYSHRGRNLPARRVARTMYAILRLQAR